MKETERIKAVADADRLKDVQAIDISKHIEQEEGKANISSIRNEIMAKKRVRIFNSIFNVFNNIEKHDIMIYHIQMSVLFQMIANRCRCK